MTHRAWRLRCRPVGAIRDSDLELCVEPKPTPAEGQLLVKNLFISIDPTQRIWMSEKAQYMPNVELNDVMRAPTIGVVEESNDLNYPVGTYVYGFGGCQEFYAGIPGVNVLYKAGENNGLTLTADLSLCSIIIGLTAAHGVKLMEPTDKDTVVVSGAAGAVGSLFGQLVKLRGAKVIGIAGRDEKCAWMKNDLGFDEVINYKTQDVEKSLAALAPDGVSGYFDNVGGSITDAVLANARLKMKLIVCGSISEYDDNWSGQKNWNMILMRRVTVIGMICLDHLDELSVCKEELSQLALAGKVKYVEDIREGLENYPATLRLLLSGDNKGKLILKI